jgi:hypothetical protein
VWVCACVEGKVEGERQEASGKIQDTRGGRGEARTERRETRGGGQRTRYKRRETKSKDKGIWRWLLGLLGLLGLPVSNPTEWGPLWGISVWFI